MKKNAFLAIFVTSILLVMSFNSASGVTSDDKLNKNDPTYNINPAKLEKYKLTKDQIIELEEELENMKDEDPGAYKIIQPQFYKAITEKEDDFQFDLIKFGIGIIDAIQRVKDFIDENEEENEQTAKFFKQNIVIFICNKLKQLVPKFKNLIEKITSTLGSSVASSKKVSLITQDTEVTPEEIEFVNRLESSLAKGPIKAIEEFTGEDLPENIDIDIDEKLKELGINQPDWDDIDVDGGEEKGEDDGHNWRGLDDKYDWGFFNASLVLSGFVLTIPIFITKIEFLVLIALYTIESLDFKDFYSNIALKNLDFDHYFEADGY